MNRSKTTNLVALYGVPSCSDEDLEMIKAAEFEKKSAEEQQLIKNKRKELQCPTCRKKLTFVNKYVKSNNTNVGCYFAHGNGEQNACVEIQERLNEYNEKSTTYRYIPQSDLVQAQTWFKNQTRVVFCSQCSQGCGVTCEKWDLVRQGNTKTTNLTNETIIWTTLKYNYTLPSINIVVSIAFFHDNEIVCAVQLKNTTGIQNTELDQIAKQNFYFFEVNREDVIQNNTSKFLEVIARKKLPSTCSDCQRNQKEEAARQELARQEAARKIRKQQQEEKYRKSAKGAYNCRKAKQQADREETERNKQVAIIYNKQRGGEAGTELMQPTIKNMFIKSNNKRKRDT